jgi:hypothetical protein
MNIKPILLLSAFGIAGAANAELLSYFNFNDAEANSVSGTEIDYALHADGGTLKTRTTMGITTPYNWYYLGTGTLTNAEAGDVSGAGFLISGGSLGNGTALTMTVNAVSGSPLSNLNFSFAGVRTATSFTSYQLAYSVNGGGFTNFGSAFDLEPTANPFGFSGGTSTLPAALRTFNLSSLGSGINTLSLRLTYTGATNPFTGRSVFDNIKLTGTVTPVPEPGTWAVLGLGAVAFLRRRKA